jgi:thermostable 8-oxoguanine DNA glycosylase
MVPFTSKEEIQKLVSQAPNTSETKRLTAYFKQLKEERAPFYLSLIDLEEILGWKLRGQIRRQAKKRTENTDQNVILITKAAFSVTHENNDIEITLRLRLLSTLSGVEIPVASAILTLCYPDQYCVIDFRNWRQFNELRQTNNIIKTGYSAKEYINYLKQVRQWAHEFAVTPQEIDIAIWQKDRSTFDKSSA